MTPEDEMSPSMTDVSPEELRWKRSTKAQFHYASHSILFAVTSVFWISIFLLFTVKQPPKPSQQAALAEAPNLITGAKYVACGRSTEEAKALGCVYDILSNHWVPAPCMDQGAVDVYKEDGTWFGYADENRTQLLTIEDMSMAPFYYTNMRDHVLHCASLWKKQFREFFGQRKALDSMIVDEHHTIHCSDFLIRMTQFGPDLRNVPIKVEVGYAGCHIRDVDLL
ncbi:hypothetical protein UA08_07390 [Talaromyces atroroseus]|uniref:Uncharacterized protein n=1 Tax=Talaromyces atroroseus TaxID=1441469 RepID=A0A225AE48_TALAT|nr:hypothetical protein UA08_07390 [Talaromyces atroroseus]OKL57303.1 hypothetical protein UA08_07390 [Talaromyces atroroseus]